MRIRFLKAVHGSTPVLMGSGASVSFGSSAGSGAVMRFLLSPILSVVLVLALVIAMLFATAGTAHATEVITGAIALANPALLVTPSPKTRELNEKIGAKSQTLHEVFEKAGENVDFSNKEVLKLTGCSDSKGVVEWVRSANKELEDLGKDLDSAKDVDRIRAENEKRRSTPANPIAQPGGGSPANGGERIVKTLGQIVMGSHAVQQYKKQRVIGASIEGEKDEHTFGLKELKTLFQTSAGWAPESTRVPGLIIDAVTRPIQVLDVIPMARTDMAAVVYMEETTRTHSAAERSEGAAYAEAAFVMTQRSSTVRSIGDSIPVTDEQLEDVAGAESYLNQRLMFGVRQRLDRQVVLGDGNAPNLTGILNASGLQTQAKGTDPVPDAIYKGLVKCRVTGRAFPNAAIINPNDWQDVRLLRTADGQYIWGSPSEAGPERIWGVRVISADVITENTGLVGDFANFCALYERKGIEVAVGYVNTQFTEGEKTIRAGLRAAFVVYRGAAFCQITGI